MAGADLTWADLSYANLSGANLKGADLSETQFNNTNLEGAILTGCRVHGIATWRIHGEPANQTDLIITRNDEATITVDDIRVAQFVYLLLNNQNIRNVVGTIGKKGVLILGRFTPERKEILNVLREALRKRNLVPMVFDFDRNEERDFTETILTLTGMSLFIIADITNPRSAPLELQATVPNYMIPFVPIIMQGEKSFSMFRDLKGKFDWVLDELEYDTLESLLAALDLGIITPAMKKHKQLLNRKAAKSKVRHAYNYIKP